MQSMTGFGHSERTLEEVDISVDIKSVNSRFLDILIRLPKEINALETDIRHQIQSALNRGRIEVFINLLVRSSSQYAVCEPVLQNYLRLAEEIRSRGIPGELGLTALLQLPGVVAPRQPELGGDEIRSLLSKVVEEALQGVIAIRQAEGAALKRDLVQRLAQLSELVEKISLHSDQMARHYREKLQQRIRELEEAVTLDDNRLAQELFYYVERAGISEEIVRLRSHIQRFQGYLEESDGKRVGKNLDFLCQEMNREMNTILSKSSLPDLSEIAVEGKAEIEKIREQVQNVE